MALKDQLKSQNYKISHVLCPSSLWQVN